MADIRWKGSTGSVSVPWDPMVCKNVVPKVMEFLNLIKYLEDTWDGCQSGDDMAEYLSPDMKTILEYMALQRQRGIPHRTGEYWDLRGKLIVACIMFRKGQRWRNGSYICAVLHDPDLRVSCDGWTASGELLEIKCTGTARGDFQSLNLSHYDRFVGVMMDPCISESIIWADLIKYALGGPLPQGLDNHAVAWEQTQPVLMSRVGHRPRKLNRRGDEVVRFFYCNETADEPCCLDDLDFI
jgi:hypothetical protein